MSIKHEFNRSREKLKTYVQKIRLNKIRKDQGLLDRKGISNPMN